MKIFGSISRLVSVLFRKDSQDITVRPNQATTYTAGRDVQLPAGDTDHVLVSASSTATLTNKTIDADGTGNSITNIDNDNIKSAAGIDASKLADGSVSNTEFQYIGGLTSDAQTQLTNAADDIADLITLSGVAANAETLGTFTGTTIPDNSDIKEALQALETAVEASEDAVFQADWETADGATFIVEHNLNSKDVRVELYDKSDDATIFVDSVVRTDADNVTLTASEAPGAGGWRVLIRKF